MAVAPFFRAKVAPFFRAKDKPQTGTVNFFDKALSKLAGMKDIALSAYLHRKATAWYKRFPPIHSLDRAKDPKTPQVDGGDGAGRSPEDEEDVEDRPVASQSSLDEADDEALLLHSFYGCLQESKSGMEMPKVPVVSRYFVAYLASFVAIAPFFRAKDESVQTWTV